MMGIVESKYWGKDTNVWNTRRFRCELDELLQFEDLLSGTMSRNTSDTLRSGHDVIQNSERGKNLLDARLSTS